MISDDRRGWVAFAFIFWFGLGFASGDLVLCACSIVLLAALVIDEIARGHARRNRSPQPQPDRRHDKPEGAVLDV